MNTAITCLSAPVMATLTVSPNAWERDPSREAVFWAVFCAPIDGQPGLSSFSDHNYGRFADLIDQAELFRTVSRSDGSSRRLPPDEPSFAPFEAVAHFSVPVSGLRH